MHQQKRNLLHHILKHDIIPRLTPSMHKGEAGRICVIGGCLEYTGAPFYAAVSALKTGCDLSFVVSSKHATWIKSYSPEIMVYPAMYESDLVTECKRSEESCVAEAVEKVKALLPRVHTLVVGPGLGRDKVIMRTVAEVINEAKKLKMPIVIDGDGLFLVSEQVQLITGYRRAMLTPNHAEFKRLCEKVFTKDQLQGKDFNDPQLVVQLCSQLGGVTIVRKGQKDLISNGSNVKLAKKTPAVSQEEGHLQEQKHNEEQDMVALLECDETGSPRRCGGMGDILSGCLGTFVNWSTQCATRANKSPEYLSFSENEDEDARVSKAMLVGAYGACMITKKAALAAFEKKFRGFTAPDVMEQLPNVFESQFPCKY